MLGVPSQGALNSVREREPSRLSCAVGVVLGMGDGSLASFFLSASEEVKRFVVLLKGIRGQGFGVFIGRGLIILKEWGLGVCFWLGQRY